MRNRNVEVRNPKSRKSAPRVIFSGDRLIEVDMPPGTRRTYRVTADALGRWAFHCHLLYHMEAGMFREVRVEE